MASSANVNMQDSATNGSKGNLKVQLTGSSNKVFTVTTITQAWDYLTVTVSNGKTSFTFDKNKHNTFQVLKTTDGKNSMVYGTGTSSSDTWTIEVLNKTTNKPTKLAWSYANVSAGGKQFVHTLTVVAEDTPSNSSMEDYNDAGISITWYNYSG